MSFVGSGSGFEGINLRKDASPGQNAAPKDPTVAQYSYRPGTLQMHEINLKKSELAAKESELSKLQLIFLIDISTSMKKSDEDPEGVGKSGIIRPGKWTRYDNMVKLLQNMAETMLDYDTDHRIPCFFFHTDVMRIDITDSKTLIDKVKAYPPSGTTALHRALREAMKELNETDNFLFVIFTDGAPDSTSKVEKLISKIHTMDTSGERMNLLFVRFGDDPGAMAFLQQQDNHPVYGDNVDTKSDNAAYKLGVKLLLLNALYEKIENDPYWIPILAECQ